jgi:hypothetical protein
MPRSDFEFCLNFYGVNHVWNLYKSTPHCQGQLGVKTYCCCLLWRPKLCVLFSTEDLCSAYCLQRKAREQIICRKLPVIILAERQCYHYCYGRQFVALCIVYSRDSLFIVVSDGKGLSQLACQEEWKNCGVVMLFTCKLVRSHPDSKEGVRCETWSTEINSKILD